MIKNIPLKRKYSTYRQLSTPCKMSRKPLGSKSSKVKTTIKFKDECSFCSGPCKTKESPFNRRYRPLDKTTHTASFETNDCFITLTEVEEKVVRSRSNSSKGEEKSTAKKHRNGRRLHGKKRKCSDLDIDIENLIAMRELEKKEELRVRKRLGLIPDKIGKYQKLLNDIGPFWYQELSHNQIMYTESLGSILIMDMEEFNLCRMHKVMDGLGISPPPTNQQLLKAARLSYLNPVLFLIYLFKFTSSEETLLHKDFSVNDRIILSAMAHIALPRTMMDLEYRLPKNFFQKPQFSAKIKHKPLSTDLTKTYYKNLKEKPESPYLQTLPYFQLRCRQDEMMRRKEERYLNRLAFKSRMPSNIKMYDDTDTIPKKKDDIEDSLTVIKSQNDATVKKHKPPRRLTKVQGKTASELAVHFTEVKKEPDVPDPEPGPSKDSQNAKHKNRVQIIDEDGTISEIIPDADAVDIPIRKEPVEIANTAVVPEIKATLPTQPDPMATTEELKQLQDKLNIVAAAEVQQEEVKPEAPNSDKVYNRIVNSYYTPIDTVLDSLDAAFQLALDGMVPDPGVKPPPPEPTDDPSPVASASSALILGRDAGLPEPIPTMPSIVSVVYGYWSGLRMDLPSEGDSTEDVLSIKSSASSCSKMHSRKHIVRKILAQMGREGNILAAMPNVVRLPAIYQWLAYTENPILKKTKKEELLNKSKGDWAVQQLYPEIVEIPWPRFQCLRLDWSHKNWFKRQVDQLYDRYRRDFRRAQVNDARRYWPTMAMYDFRAPPTFKDVYYAYMQSREEDTAQKKLFFQ